MPLVRLDPPGTYCHYAALWDFLRGVDARTFLEVGVGSGNLARALVRRGLSGHGFDPSAAAVDLARARLQQEITDRRFTLMQADVFDVEAASFEPVDLAISMMVMEHIRDDVGFLRATARFVRPGGYVVISVPGRRDRWSIEDETVGHLRRYDRADLQHVLDAAQLRDAVVRSVSVPTANLLYALGNLMIRRSLTQAQADEDKQAQTYHSGTREIPFKTVFPAWCRLILNPVSLYPLFVLQRMFYRTDLGLELMALARVPDTAG
jgi:2-polyprenyl-3-methyl-5-hydroxy-6-metoxy-1,4-benzoquinol methylase